MRICNLALVCGGAILVCGLLSSLAQAAPTVSPYTLIEAESDPQGMVKADPDASGGRYVSRDGAYQPLLTADIPAAAGASFVIWARVRGTAIQLKGVATDGSQHEFNWVWDKPDEWKWVSFGRHTRAEMGVKLLLMQGTDPKPDAGLDAVVLTGDDAFSPEALILALPPILPVAVMIHWDTVIAQATPRAYGLNAFAGFDPTVTGDKTYQANLAYMAPGILRLHNWGMMEDSAKSASGWIDEARQRWDAVKIQKDLLNFPLNAPLLINIPGWPDWMDTNKDGFLDTGQTAAYAKLCADLVKLVNGNKSKRRVVYWEITNEQDGRYFVDFHADGGRGPLKDPAKPDRVEELAAIYNRCALAMKAVDPAIKIGGPAAERPDLTEFVRRFAHDTAPNLDFFSYHAYASGSAADSDTAIYDRAEGFGAATKAITDILHAESPKRPIATIFDEYNISWTWETRDPRMTGVKGVVFDALAISAALKNGADATLAWNERDGIYGKTDINNVRRPGAALFHLLNETMRGAVVWAASENPKAVAVYAVAGARGRKALLLINRTAREQRAAFTPWIRQPLTSPRIASDGYHETKTTGSEIALPADSVTVLTSP